MKLKLACTAALAALGLAAGTTSLSAADALTPEMLAQAPGDIAVVESWSTGTPGFTDGPIIDVDWALFAQAPGDVDPFSGMEPTQSAGAQHADWMIWAEAPGDLYTFTPIQLAQGPGDINVDWSEQGNAFAQLMGETVQTY